MKAPRFGLGFRTPHARDLHPVPEGIDWLEVVSDHYVGVGGPRRALLERLRRDFPIALHGVGLDIAGCDPLDESYLAGLRELVEACEPLFVSDHLCWTSLDGLQSHDLLPVACTPAVLAHVAERVDRVQQCLGRRLLLENASAYVAFRASEMDDADFVSELCRRSGCGVLLDVNNLLVNAANLGDRPERWLEVLPESAIGYLHLAGHAVLPDVRIDTHAEPVPSSVWRLFESVARRYPSADVILERDDALPPLAELVAELGEARARHAAAIAHQPAGRAYEAPRASGSQGTTRSWSGLQRTFWRRTIDGDPGPEGHDRLLASDRPVTSSRGARVYRDAYRAGLHDALSTNFPTLARVLAPDDWRRLARDFVRAHPPRGPGFVTLGARLPGFIRRFRLDGDYGVPVAVMAEIADLEQAQLEAQTAPDPARRLLPQDLASIPDEAWEHARPRLVPGARIVRCDHDVAPTLEAVAKGDAPERPAPTPQTYLVARGREALLTQPIDRPDAPVLEALLAGDSFGAACDRVCTEGDDEGQVVGRAARLLVRLAQQGLLGSLTSDRHEVFAVGATRRPDDLRRDGG